VLRHLDALSKTSWYVKAQCLDVTAPIFKTFPAETALAATPEGLDHNPITGLQGRSFPHLLYNPRDLVAWSFTFLEEFYINSVVPFDMRIDDKEITALILAESFDEAAGLLDAWLYGQSR
jgi:hypothetical protein